MRVRILALGLTHYDHIDASERGWVVLVDEATGEEKWRVQAHDGVVCVAVSPDGRFVASMGNNDGHWRLWDAESGEVNRVRATHDGTGACICEDLDEWGHGRLVKAGCPVVAHSEFLWALSFSSCGQKIATRDSAGAVIVWDVKTREAVPMEPLVRIHHEEGGEGPDCEQTSLSFSADGARIASGDGGSSIGIWDVLTGAELDDSAMNALHAEMRDLFVDIVTQVALSPTEDWKVAIAGWGTLQLWDVVHGEMLREFPDCSLIAVFSPDGRAIATHNGREGKLVDAESGEVLFSMVGHTHDITAIAFSVPDGSKLASCSGDGACKVWDSSTGALLRTINLGRSVTSVSWARDWVRETQTAIAFAMGNHPRLGAESQVLEHEVGVVRMILDRV